MLGIKLLKDGVTGSFENLIFIFFLIKQSFRVCQVLKLLRNILPS